METLAKMAAGGCEEVIHHHDSVSGLSAIVAIHSTQRGPALGGTRWHPYASEEEALDDVLRLSAAMTAKAAVADLPLGGGKAVVLGRPEEKSPEQIDAYARLIEGLGGRYVTTTDVGTTTADMDRIARHTRHVVGVSRELGGGGDTSELTAITVHHGLRATLETLYGEAGLAGRTVAVAGVGKVGSRVARRCAEEGAHVLVADIVASRAQGLAREIGAEVIEPEAILAAECDVLSPNALGNVFHRDSIPALRCRAICGGANNQLANDPEDAELLMDRGILYAPDYVVNSGGLINASVEYRGYNPQEAERLAGRVYETTLAVLGEAHESGISTAQAARRLVRRRLAAP